MSDYPSPTLAVKKALEQFGGWSRYFARSSETIDKEIVIGRASEPGFWERWAIARAQEYFVKEVSECVEVLKKEYKDKRNKKLLEKLIAKALLEEGWKPPKGKILREAIDLRNEVRDDIKALRGRPRKRR